MARVNAGVAPLQGGFQNPHGINRFNLQKRVPQMKTLGVAVTG